MDNIITLAAIALIVVCLIYDKNLQKKYDKERREP